MDGPEIGSALDVAKRLKDSMLEKIPAEDTYTPLAFVKPRAISEQFSLTYLAERHKRMQPTSTQSTMEAATVGAFAVWWLSLAAGTFATAGWYRAKQKRGIGPIDIQVRKAQPLSKPEKI
jgi:hypothetical protein